MKTYRIRYKLERGAFSSEELKSAGDGGTDALVLVSILRGPEPHDGSKSVAVVSLDGYTGEDLTATELFQAWVHLADAVLQVDGPDWQKQIAKDAFEKVRAAVLARRE